MVFYQPEKQFCQEQLSFSVKIGFRTIIIMVFTCKKNTINTKYFIQTEKGFCSCYFCYWKPLLKLGRIQFLKNDLPASGNQGVWKPFLLHFSDIPTSDSFFCLVEKYFQRKTSFQLVETDFLASDNRFLLFRGFSSQWKPSLKLVETNFKRTSIFQPMKTNFLASGNHFLPFSQTAVSCCQ